MLDDKDKSKSKKSKPVVVPRGRTAPLPPPRTSTASLSLPPHPRASSPAGPGRPPHSTQSPRTRPPATSPSPSWRSPGGPPEAQPQGPYVAKNKYGSQHKPSSSKASSGNNPEIMKRSLRSGGRDGTLHSVNCINARGFFCSFFVYQKFTGRKWSYFELFEEKLVLP